MKKILHKKNSIILPIILLFFLTSCNTTTDNISDTTSSVSSDSMSEHHITAEQYYDLGMDSFKKKEYIDAINYFKKSTSFNDAETKILEAQKEITNIKERSTIAYNLQKTAIGYINDDYSFEVYGDLSAYESVKDLTNLSRIETSFSYLVGVTQEGKVRVYKTAEDDSRKSSSIEKAMDWSNIKQVEIVGRSIIGLTNDGSFVYSIDEKNMEYYQPNFEDSYNWKDISYFKADYTYGIQALSNEKKPRATKYNEFLDDDYKLVAMDVGNFVLMATPDRIMTRGLPMSITGIDETGIVDVAVGSNFAVFLYDTGKMVVWNTDNEIIEITETDNIVAVETMTTDSAFVAFRTDGTIHLFDYNSKIASNDKIIVHKKHISPGDNKTQQPIQETEKEPSIGMTKDEVLKSTWGEPEKKNITETLYGIKEQWVYSNNRYIYFTNGIVTSIQKSE